MAMGLMAYAHKGSADPVACCLGQVDDGDPGVV